MTDLKDTDSCLNSARTSAAIFASPGHPSNPHFLYAAHPISAFVRKTAKTIAKSLVWLLFIKARAALPLADLVQLLSMIDKD